MNKAEKIESLKKIVLDILKMCYNSNIRIEIHASKNGSVKVNVEELDV